MEEIKKLIEEITELTKRRAELYEEYSKLGYEKALKWAILIKRLSEIAEKWAKIE